MNKIVKPQEIWNLLKEYVPEHFKSVIQFEFHADADNYCKSYIRAFSKEYGSCYVKITIEQEKEILDKFHKYFGIPDSAVTMLHASYDTLFGEVPKISLTFIPVKQSK